jgi:hypothetical protein
MNELDRPVESLSDSWVKRFWYVLCVLWGLFFLLVYVGLHL